MYLAILVVLLDEKYYSTNYPIEYMRIVSRPVQYDYPIYIDIQGKREEKYPYKSRGNKNTGFHYNRRETNV